MRLKIFNSIFIAQISKVGSLLLESEIQTLYYIVFDTIF